MIHHIRSNYDYQKHYLPPLRTSPRPLQPPSRPRTTHANFNRRPTRREREWGRREREAQEETDALERAIRRRRWIYEHHLYAKVCLASMSVANISDENVPRSMLRQILSRGIGHTPRRPSSQHLRIS